MNAPADRLRRAHRIGLALAASPRQLALAASPRQFALALAASLAAVGAATLVLGARDALAIGTARARETSTPRVDESQLADASTIAQRSDAVPTPTLPARPAVPPQPKPEDLGRLVVRAVDAQTGEPLDRIRVRALSSERIADEESWLARYELELKLTPDAYALLVLVPGYEPVELSAITVEKGQTVIAPTAVLRAGSGQIRGRIRGELAGDASLRVEIAGVGRRPCAECAQPDWNRRKEGGRRESEWQRSYPCRDCGFSAGFTRLPASDSGTYSQDGLASGSYAVRVVDAQGRPQGEPRQVVLRAAERASVDVDAVPSRSVVVEVLDTDGETLAPGWGRRVRAWGAEGVVPEFDDKTLAFVDQLDWQCEFSAGGSRFAVSGFVTPNELGTTRGPTASHCGRGRQRPSDDRARLAGEALWPALVPATFPPYWIASELAEDGRVRFDGLPPTALVLQMRCDRFETHVEVPAARELVNLRARLVRAQVARPDAAKPPLNFRALDAARFR